MMMMERWKPLVGWEGLYEISSEGRVYSIRRNRILRPSKLWSGHLQVIVSRPGERRSLRVAREILKAFVGLPDAKQEACHNNGIPGDNRLDNLRWDSHRENMIDIVRHGRHHWTGNKDSGRHWADRTHCSKGHEYTPENTHYYQRKDRNMTVERRCRTCRYENTKKWLASR